MLKVLKKRMGPVRRLPAAVAALLLTCGGNAVAQTPSAITPGSVQDTVRGDRMPARPVTPQVVLPTPAAPSPHDPRARRFRVNAFQMAGNTVFTQQQLKRVVERFVDYELNLYDLSRAADAITEFYHNHGYTLARAYIPAQRVEAGVVRIQIVEGRFGKVSFSGNQRHSTEFLSARSSLLAPGSLVTTDRLEHDLLLLNDLPGLRAKATLEPGEEVGTSDVEIKVEEKLFDISINGNNFGRKETGRNRLETALNINSPLGWGDQLALSGSVSEHSLVRYWKAGYSFPLNTLGTRLMLSSSKVEYEVSANTFAQLGLSGDVRSEEIAVTHPLVRSRNNNENITVALRRERLTQRDLQVTRTDIDVLNIGYSISRIHRDTSVTNVSFGLTTNFKSNDHLTIRDTAPEGVLARMEFNAAHTTPFIGKWDMYLRGTMVYSRERLPDSEKFSIGGPSSVRAFRSAELRGDRGLVLSAELRHPFSVMNTFGQFRLTADAGNSTIYRVRGEKGTPGTRERNDRIGSVGFGATLYPGSGWTASIDAATAVGTVRKDIGGGARTRIWVNIGASF